MADVSHELGALRFVVDSPLSSKVAMFNNQAQQHQQSQLLNPFSSSSGRSSPKPTFSRDEYGKPLAGSLTEMRGQKANMHVLREMSELCQIISSEGYSVKDEPDMRVIPFGELFNIYNHISDKVVGILLRARKHKLVEFEGEMLFQRRDDDVPIFLLKPIKEIKEDLEAKIESIKRASSPAPQSTSVILDKAAHQLKLQAAGIVARSAPPSAATSRAGTPKPEIPPKPRSKAASPVPDGEQLAATTETTANIQTNAETKPTDLKQEQNDMQQNETKNKSDDAKAMGNVTDNTKTDIANDAAETATTEKIQNEEQKATTLLTSETNTTVQPISTEEKSVTETADSVAVATPAAAPTIPVIAVEALENAENTEQPQQPTAASATLNTNADFDNKKDANNNYTTTVDHLPTIVIETAAVVDGQDNDNTENLVETVTVGNNDNA